MPKVVFPSMFPYVSFGPGVRGGFVHSDAFDTAYLEVDPIENMISVLIHGNIVEAKHYRVDAGNRTGR